MPCFQLISFKRYKPDCSKASTSYNTDNFLLEKIRFSVCNLFLEIDGTSIHINRCSLEGTRQDLDKELCKQEDE